MKTSKIHHKPITAVPLDFQWPVADPFLFCVHHLDYYPESNGRFGPKDLSGRNIGNDFEPKDGWRMYHGKTIPGFPAHPHRGFETITIVERGYVDHADSAGAMGRYGAGDLQWMTAGRGIQHSEMFPLLDWQKDSDGKIDNTLELFQIWLNLPASKKFAKPHYTMHWGEKIPILFIPNKNGNVTKLKLCAGEYNGVQALPPPPESWASQKENLVWIWLLELEPGADFSIPIVEVPVFRNLYYYQGGESFLSFEKMRTDDSQNPLPILAGHSYSLPWDARIVIQNNKSPSKFLFLQGKPIEEPVFSYGPFVMNTLREIQQAYEDFQNTGFGGWNYDRYDVVHGEKGRFALYSNGKVEYP